MVFNTNFDHCEMESADQAAIYFKTTRGLIVMGGVEQGFLNRLARLAYVGSLS
jgi:hypothetical protein